MITNDEVADVLKLYSQLLDVHGKDSFRAKSYSNAAFQLERLPAKVAEMTSDVLASQKGMGGSMAGKVLEIIARGSFEQLDALLQITPPGVIEMLRIKGIGPKKINTIWQEMGIESPGELLYACNENRLINYKGFGEKTQHAIKEAIEFMHNQQGKLLLADALPIHHEWLTKLERLFEDTSIVTVGSIARGDDIVMQLDYLIVADIEVIVSNILTSGLSASPQNILPKSVTVSSLPLPIVLHSSSTENFGTQTVLLTAMETFILKLDDIRQGWSNEKHANATDFFEAFDMEPVPPYLQTSSLFSELSLKHELPQVIQHKDIKGIIHSHSNYSDGLHTLQEMAVAAKAKGFEYLVISDHSKSAFYANGLQDERVLQQHAEIDKLNSQLTPFKIFKSIESDILNDGSLDYSNDVLSSFDIVIASVHSNLKMIEEKAMARLLAAIANPFTSILGHPTGRLLLSRAGYPIDHHKIIEACIAHNVVIEINAHPRRLDLDWQWLPYAISKGAMLSINPDAHWIEGFNDVLYGVLAARKGGLTAKKNLSSMPLAAFEDFVREQKLKRPPL